MPGAGLAARSGGPAPGRPRLGSARASESLGGDGPPEVDVPAAADHQSFRGGDLEEPLAKVRGSNLER